MKIVAGLGAIDDYIRLCEAGADEFFCGYVPFKWTEKYGISLPLNRREVLYYKVQIGCLSDLKILRKMIDVYKVPVKITFNSLFYTAEQLPLITEIICECMENGFDTFIIADPALIFYLREHDVNCKIHLSGETAEVNHLMMEKFNEFSINRYIFHRKNTIEDMKSCIDKNPQKNMEYEAFILNEYCHYAGAFCNSLHCDELCHICKVPYELGSVNGERVKIRNIVSEEVASDNYEEEYVTGSTGCGLCALPSLQNAGVTHLKVVGRGNYVEFMEQDIKALKKALKLVDEIQCETEYCKDVKNEVIGGMCSGECYYSRNICY